MKRESLLIIGRRPPPIGGVTIHVDRLCKWLELRRISFSFVDFRESGFFTLLRAVCRHRIVHIHATNPFFMLFMVIYAKAMKTVSVVTVHGNLSEYRGLRALVVRMALRIADVPILLNQESYSQIKTKCANARRISAFLPPLEEEDLDKAIAKEIARRSSGKSMVFATNAYNLVFDNHGREIYGITEIINVIKDKNCLLVVSDPSGKYAKYAQKKCPEVLGDDVLFISEPHSFYSVLASVDVFIRNTTTDGDSLSVHEALSLGKKVWATNCVTRPVGVHIYANLDEAFSIQFDPIPYSPPQVVDEIVRLYEQLLANLPK